MLNDGKPRGNNHLLGFFGILCYGLRIERSVVTMVASRLLDLVGTFFRKVINSVMPPMRSKRRNWTEIIHLASHRGCFGDLISDTSSSPPSHN